MILEVTVVGGKQVYVAEVLTQSQREASEAKPSAKKRSAWFRGLTFELVEVGKGWRHGGLIQSCSCRLGARAYTGDFLSIFQMPC